MQGNSTKSGWRYAVEYPIGIETAVLTSGILYPTRGAAIDAMTAAYPPAYYPDAKRSIMADESSTITPDPGNRAGSGVTIPGFHDSCRRKAIGQ